MLFILVIHFIQKYFLYYNFSPLIIIIIIIIVIGSLTYGKSQFILDEPFNGVEDYTVNIIRELLNEEKKKGKIIIIASHIKEDINILFDVVFEVKEGKVLRVK